MKKVIGFLVIFLFVLAEGNGLLAQIPPGGIPRGTYTFRLQFRSIDPHLPFEFQEYRVTVEQGGQEEVFFYWSHENPVSTDPIVRTYQTMPTRILYEYSSWDNYGNSELHNDIYTFPSPEVFVFTNRAIYLGRTWGQIQLYMSLLPTEINLYSNSNNGNFTLYDPITISATTGFSNATYNWQYSIGAEDVWHNFPPSLQNRSEVTFQGSDLFSVAEFAALTNGAIRFRVSTPTHNHSPNGIVVLNPIFIAPGIENIVTEECASDENISDGTIRIFFNRDLHPSEIIYIGIGSEITQDRLLIDSLDGKNSTLVSNVPGGYSEFRVYTAITGLHANSRFYTVRLCEPVTHDITHTRITCHGANNGTITVTSWGGTESFTASLFRSGNFNDTLQVVHFSRDDKAVFSGLLPGHYAIGVSDTRSIVSQNNHLTVEITEPNPLAITYELSTSATAHNRADGSITLRLSSGTQDLSGNARYRVRLYGNENLVPFESEDSGAYLYTFNNLSGGTHTAIAQDLNGCETSHLFTITAPLPVEVTIEETHPIEWYSGNQGELTARVAGGVSPYQYQWYEQVNGAWQPIANATDSIFGSRPAGSYQVRVTDQNGVSQTATFDLTQPARIPMQITVETTRHIYWFGGNQGELTARVIGGVPFPSDPYQYQWYEEINGVWQPIANATGNVLSDLTAGTYRVQVTDQTGAVLAQYSDIIHLTQPDNVPIEIAIAVTQPIEWYSGSQGELTARVSGGVPFPSNSPHFPYQYQWYKQVNETWQPIPAATDSIIGNLSAGNYRLRVTDQSTASQTAEFVLTQPAHIPIVINIEETHPIEWHTGNQGELTARASGGVPFPSDSPHFPYQYQWYEQVNEGWQPILNATDSILNRLTAGNYQVRVTDRTAFSETAVFHLTQPDRIPIVISIEETQAIEWYSGNQGILTARATGGVSFPSDSPHYPYQYQWYREENGVMHPLPAANNDVLDQLRTGNYQVRVIDRTGFSETATFRLTQPDRIPIIISIEETQSIEWYSGNQGELTIRVSGGVPFPADSEHFPYQYQWFREENGTMQLLFAATNSVIPHLTTGNYQVRVTDRTGFSEMSAVFRLTQPDRIPIVIEIEETYFVNWHGGDQGVLTARVSGGVPFPDEMPYFYAWYSEVGGVMRPLPVPNDSIARHLTAGVYELRVTDRAGFSHNSSRYVLTQPDPITVQFTVVPAGCYGERIGGVTAAVSGGTSPYAFQWNLEGATTNTLISLEAGAYMLRVTDARGGTFATTVNVESANGLTVDSLVVQPTCLALGSIRLRLSNASAPYAVQWIDRSETVSFAADEQITREGLAPGTYTVEITDANGCLSLFSFRIEEPRAFAVSLGGDLIMNRGQSRPLAVMSDEPNLSYQWFFNGTALPDNGSSILLDRAGEFSVIATNEQGCTATDRINVRVTNEVLELDMTVPTRIEVGSPIHAVNLSTMAADRIEWQLPKGATVIEKSDLRLSFRLDRIGRYTLSMEGFRGEGASIITRNIEVVGRGEVELPDDENPLIRQFWASPNPSTGQFRVVVELHRPENFTMRLYSPDGVLMDVKEEQNTDRKTFEYEIAGTLQGAFSLHLITRADRSVLQVVIQR